MDICYLDGICTLNGMFIFIILVIHRETGGISQLGLSYQINEENTPNIRYLAKYLKKLGMSTGVRTFGLRIPYRSSDPNFSVRTFAKKSKCLMFR